MGNSSGAWGGSQIRPQEELIWAPPLSPPSRPGPMIRERGGAKLARAIVCCSMKIDADREAQRSQHLVPTVGGYL